MTISASQCTNNVMFRYFQSLFAHNPKSYVHRVCYE